MNDAEKKIRVMLVDDSAVVRGMVTKALQESPFIEVVASVMNGQSAVNIVQEIRPDIILLDVEMPEMNGLEALPLLLAASPTSKIIMVSSLTQHNADISMNALKLGATECVAKPSSRGDKSITEAFFRDLVHTVITLGKNAKNITPAAYQPTAQPSPTIIKPEHQAKSSYPLFVPSHEIRCLAIGSSTGGPQALMHIFKFLHGKNFKVPIFITQHMPATFTKILAEHLRSASGMPCEEGEEGMEAKSGAIYIAPGDYHMIPKILNNKITISLNQNDPVNFCRPAVDPMFSALAKIYGKHLLGVVLTGMGQDGLEGARTINAQGGNVVAQDEATSVVWGMPGAVAKGNQAKAVLPLGEIATLIARVMPS